MFDLLADIVAGLFACVIGAVALGRALVRITPRR
jgi:hypothetical protein